MFWLENYLQNILFESLRSSTPMLAQQCHWQWLELLVRRSKQVLASAAWCWCSGRGMRGSLSVCMSVHLLPMSAWGFRPSAPVSPHKPCVSSFIVQSVSLNKRLREVWIRSPGTGQQLPNRCRAHITPYIMYVPPRKCLSDSYIKQAEISAVSKVFNVLN